MTAFKASLQNELTKIFKRKKYVVLLLAEAVICFVCGSIQMAIGRASNVEFSASMLSNMPMSLLAFFIQIYIPLMVFMASCDLFTTEVHDGTIRAGFMRPVSRLKLYASKVSAIGIMAVIYLGLVFAVTTVMKLAAGGSSAASVSVVESFFAYALDIVPLLVVILFAAMMNQILGSPSLSIIICVIIYVGMNILGIIIPQFSVLVFTGYSQWHNIWLGVTLPFGAALTKTALLLGYGMIFAGIGYYLFERKEV